MKKLQIVIVQPVQSPYWTERLKILAQETDLELTLLLEQGTFAHRPGWQPESIRNIKINILRSAVLTSTSNGDDLGYRIQGIRSIPWRLTIALWKLRPDVVILCNALQILFCLPARQLRNFKIGLIVEDTPHSTRNHRRLSSRIKRWSYKQADRWYAFSDDAKTFLENNGIVNGVERSSWSLDMKRFCPLVVSKSTTSETVNNKTRIRVVFVGALIINKGISLLLEAWNCLSADIRQRTELYIVGSGPLKNKLEAFIEKNNLKEVKLLGQVPYSNIPTLLRNANLLILPTLQDLFSLTIIEAMASGLPVITTPFAGARELVDESTGWIVDPTVPNALTAILEKALSGQVDLSQMGLAARKRVENMDNKIVMDKFAESLRQLASVR